VTFSIHGLAVSRGVAIGRAVLVASSRIDVAHYFIDEERVEAEIDRLRVARDAVASELSTLSSAASAPAPLIAMPGRTENAATAETTTAFANDVIAITNSPGYELRLTNGSSC